MSDVAGKEPCPECRKLGNDASGDNLARYTDGGAYCFACGHSERGEGEVSSAAPASPGKKKALITDLEYRALVKRGISEETCKHFGYSVGTSSQGKTVHVARYERDGKVAQKIRDSKKNFAVLGDKGAMGLFGQQLWRDGGKKVVITEGEIDAMSVSQLQQNKWPVVSVPNGAQGAAKSIAEAIGVPYLLENPVSTLASYYRKPDYTFNPCDYGGYLTPPRDAYTKKTCLWTGNGFVMPEPKPVEPIEGSKMHLMPPSEGRANLRSVTPAGFARAVFESNYPIQCLTH